MKVASALAAVSVLILSGCAQIGAMMPPPPDLGDGGSTAPPRYVQQCQTTINRTIRDEAGASGVRFTSGRAIQVNPQVVNVQGQARVEMPRGGARMYTYLCSFLPRENDRLTTAEYSPVGSAGSGPGDGATNPPQFVQTCQAEVERKMRDEVGASRVRFTSGRALPVNPQVTNVQGEAQVVLYRGPEVPFAYLCSFLSREGGRLTNAEYSRR